jgi:hypothetical protein
LREIDVILKCYAEEGRAVQLFALHGQMMFPHYSSAGGLYANSCIFLISRGEGKRAPAYEGVFPTADGESCDIGRGWKVMCLHVTLGMTGQELEAKLRAAEDTLLGRKN